MYGFNTYTYLLVKRNLGESLKRFQLFFSLFPTSFFFFFVNFAALARTREESSNVVILLLVKGFVGLGLLKVFPQRFLKYEKEKREKEKNEEENGKEKSLKNRSSQ